MIELRPFESLGGENHGWLDAKHHFSFANYHDPARVHWGNLRVWNDDTIAPGTGFPPHPSPMSAKARSPIRTAWAIPVAPKRATCR